MIYGSRKKTILNKQKHLVSIVFIELMDIDHLLSLYDLESFQVLNDIYHSFDELCLKHSLSHVETVGSNYIACSESSPLYAVEFAFDVISHIQRVNLKDGSELRVKVGIHSGEVAETVVGIIRPQKQIVGLAVNKASRIC